MCISNVDYINGPYNVTFNAMSVRASANVIICNDNEIESNETFNLDIVPSSLTRCLGLDYKTTTVTVTIVDDDGT